MFEKNKEAGFAYMLHSIPGIGNKTLFELAEIFGSCEAVYEASEKELRDVLMQKQMDSFLKARKNWDIAGEYENLYKRGIDFYYYFGEKYPARLKDIPDPPFALYCIGRMPDENRPSVSIIGARTSSEYGKYAAKFFGEKLAENGVQIVSGMARGIDGIGQRAAIGVGGESFAVLGSGVDVCYPDENRFLYDDLIVSGGIISEYIPGTEPKPQHFPPRNRIISGLSDAVLVIEARQKSGTLITVDMALEQGREVFALPGRINDNLSRGCNSLIRQGAQVAVGPEDIIEYLRRTGSFAQFKEPVAQGKDEENGESKSNRTMYNLTDIQKIVIKHMDMYPLTASKLFEEMVQKGHEISISEVMNTLVELCIMGIAGQSGGGFFLKGNVKTAVS